MDHAGQGQGNTGGKAALTAIRRSTEQLYRQRAKEARENATAIVRSAHQAASRRKRDWPPQSKGK